MQIISEHSLQDDQNYRSGNPDSHVLDNGRTHSPLTLADHFAMLPDSAGLLKFAVHTTSNFTTKTKKKQNPIAEINKNTNQDKKSS